ncbi:MAG: hypothetical protein MHMPM18_003799, partial [Marteilia pararefringens]
IPAIEKDLEQIQRLLLICEKFKIAIPQDTLVQKSYIEPTFMTLRSTADQMICEKEAFTAKLSKSIKNDTKILNDKIKNHIDDFEDVRCLSIESDVKSSLENQKTLHSIATRLVYEANKITEIHLNFLIDQDDDFAKLHAINRLIDQKLVIMKLYIKWNDEIINDLIQNKCIFTLKNCDLIQIIDDYDVQMNIIGKEFKETHLFTILNESIDNFKQITKCHEYITYQYLKPRHKSEISNILDISDIYSTQRGNDAGATQQLPLLPISNSLKKNRNILTLIERIYNSAVAENLIESSLKAVMYLLNTF